MYRKRKFVGMIFLLIAVFLCSNFLSAPALPPSIRIMLKDWQKLMFSAAQVEVSIWSGNLPGSKGWLCSSGF